MSRELSLYEAMGGTYKSVDGILYPNITCGSDDTLSVSITDVGKYGMDWIFLYERKSCGPIPSPCTYGSASS